MSNGLLCIGGAADGQYVYPVRELKHNDRYEVPARASEAVGCTKFTGFTTMFTEIYKVWQWHQSVDHRTRLYLIPPSWDGFEAMDWLERRAYKETTRERA